MCAAVTDLASNMVISTQDQAAEPTGLAATTNAGRAQPWKAWLDKEIAARKEAEVDDEQRADQQKLRKAYLESPEGQRMVIATESGNASG